MVKVFLVNFGYHIYEGDSIYEAMAAAETSGFEATVHNLFDDTTLSFSPIGGWKLNEVSHGW